jgi:hypothetical protein
MIGSTVWIWNLLPAILAVMVVACYAQRVATPHEPWADANP